MSQPMNAPSLEKAPVFQELGKFYEASKEVAAQVVEKISSKLYESYPQNPFISPSQREAVFKQQIEKCKEELSKEIKSLDWTLGLKRIQQIAQESTDLNLKPWLVLNEHLRGLNIEDMLASGFSLIDHEAVQAAYTIVLDDMEKGDYSIAIELLTTLTFFSPRIYELWMALGMSQLYSQNYKKAFLAFVYACALKPHLSASYWHCAFALQQEGRYSEAAEFIQTAQNSQEDTASTKLIQQVLHNQKA
jgi:uncharacterized protein HemY